MGTFHKGLLATKAAVRCLSREGDAQTVGGVGELPCVPQSINKLKKKKKSQNCKRCGCVLEDFDAKHL